MLAGALYVRLFCDSEKLSALRAFGKVVQPGNLALGVQAGDGKIVVRYKPVTRLKFET